MRIELPSHDSLKVKCCLIRRRCDLECGDLDEVRYSEAALAAAQAERVVGWALSRFLSSDAALEPPPAKKPAVDGKEGQGAAPAPLQLPAACLQDALAMHASAQVCSCVCHGCADWWCVSVEAAPALAQRSAQSLQLHIHISNPGCCTAANVSPLCAHRRRRCPLRSASKTSPTSTTSRRSCWRR